MLSNSLSHASDRGINVLNIDERQTTIIMETPINAIKIPWSVLKGNWPKNR
jgi:hypothetical protein